VQYYNYTGKIGLKAEKVEVAESLPTKPHKIWKGKKNRSEVSCTQYPIVLASYCCCNKLAIAN